MKISLALASAALVALSSCGGSGGGGGADSSYCKDVKNAQKTFGSLSASNASQLDAAFATLHKLADEAPSEIDGDWKKLDGAITMVEKALKDAGLKFSDFDKIQKGEIPPGVDVAKLTGLAAQFQKLNGPEFSKASKNIEKHAKKVCKVDLNAS